MTAAVLTKRQDNGSYFPFSDKLVKCVASVFRGKPSLAETDIVKPEWVDASQRQLEKVLQLEIGWDGYRAGPIRRDVISYTEIVLNIIMSPKTPAPHITPMAHSGLMIEWHLKGIDLEIEIENSGNLWLSADDAWTSQEYEGALTNNFSVVQEWIDNITKRASC